MNIDFEHLDFLIHSMLDGNIGDESLEELEMLLVRDDKARERYVEIVKFENLMLEHYTTSKPPVVAATNVMPTIDPTVPAQ